MCIHGTPASQLTCCAQIKEEIVKREREWREAWIVHELKTQEIREKEKGALRDQFAQERETWGLKIKTVSNRALRAVSVLLT